MAGFYYGAAISVGVMLVLWTWESRRVHREWVAIVDKWRFVSWLQQQYIEALKKRDDADWWKDN